MAEYFGNICTCRRCNGVVHTIKRGDSLYLLSRHYNVSVNDIMRANSNVNVYNLQIGDQICIPVSRPTPAHMPGQGNRPNQGGQMSGQSGNQMGGQNRPGQMGNQMGVRPRESDEETEDLIEDLLEELTDTSAEVGQESQATETSTSCCGGMKVRDVLQNEDMTMEELARMIRNM